MLAAAGDPVLDLVLVGEPVDVVLAEQRFRLRVLLGQRGEGVGEPGQRAVDAHREQARRE